MDSKFELSVLFKRFTEKILTKLSKFIGRLKRNTLKVKIIYVNPNLIIDYWIKKLLSF